MGSIPLSAEEIADTEEKLVEAKKQQQLANQYVAYLEQQLHDRTTWVYDSEAFSKMCKEVEEIARKDRERSEQLEIERYGRVLTGAERQGWTHKPKEVGRKT